MITRRTPHTDRSEDQQPESRPEKTPMTIIDVVRQFMESLNFEASPQEEAIRRQRFFDQLVNAFTEREIYIKTIDGEKIGKIFRIDYANPAEPKVVILIPDAEFKRKKTLDGQPIAISVPDLMSSHPQFLVNFLGQFSKEDLIAFHDPSEPTKTIRAFIDEVSIGDAPMIKLLMKGKEKIIPGIEFAKLQPAVIGS